MINSKELITYTQHLSLLFVEDHDELRENTTEILKNFFHYVDSSPNGKDALMKYKQHHEQHSKYYDIVISDIQMPKLNGVELTKAIYAANPLQTIIVLSAHDESKYLLALVNIGIEYFIKKPIDYQEFLEVLLNTSKKIYHATPYSLHDTTKIQLNDAYAFDMKNNYLVHNKNVIYLTKYEILFMQLLCKHIGKIYSNEDIVSHYHLNSENINAANIRKLVSKLRKKLPQKTIESVYGVGYRLLTSNNI